MLAASSRADWSQLQLEAVRLRWLDAASDIPYYSDLVTTGNAPAEIRSWADFQSIPVLTRQVIQDRPRDFLRRSAPPKGFVTTAGSTGTPLRFGMNQECRDLMRIVKLTAWMDFGYTPASRLFLIWGHAHLLGTGWKGRLNHLKRKAADAILGYQRVDAYRLNRASCLEYAERLVRFRPLGLIGYASALDLFARYTSEYRERFRALKLKFVLATAEPMPHPETESLLEDLFGCPVVQEYGGAEFGQVAFKKGTAPFEVYHDLVYLECEAPLPDSLDTHPMLVTTLYPRYLPLFRYRVGDALLGPERLPHGHVQSFAGISGRINDEIKFEDGNSIHSVAIFHCIHQEPTVINIQMLLKDEGIEIRLINTTHEDAALESRIRKRLAQVHPLLGKARITFAEDLITNRAGKRRWFVDERSKSSAFL
jgi:phenylacetate-CoA ligase